MKILVIGINVRYIACSAARAGHYVIALDCYCDQDLKKCVAGTDLLLNRTEEVIHASIEKYTPDAVVLGAGFEEIRLKGVRVLNNFPEKISLVSNKLWLAGWLESKGFPHIPTRSSPEGIAFPVIVKPFKGAGGVGCRLVRSQAELNWKEGLVVQDLIEGKPASVSVISDGHEAKALAINEQLIGLDWTGAMEFKYCGNITPLEPYCFGLDEIAEDLITELNLVGSNGVDFLISENGPVVVEVNPRFQGSLDTVELSTGLNVFQAHLQSFDGKLPSSTGSLRSAGRAIIFASKDIQIKEDLSDEWTTDVPIAGSTITKYDPVLSVLTTGKDRGDVLSRLKEKTAKLRKRIDPS